MRPPCGHAGWGSDLVKKAAPEKLSEKKRQSRRLTRFAGDGCLKIEMSNDAAGRAPLGQTRSAATVFSLIPAPEDGRAAIISTLIETANLNDVAGVLAVPVRARRSKTVIAVGSILQHFARQVTRTRKPCGRAPRRASKPTPRSGITAEFRPRLAPNS